MRVPFYSVLGQLKDLPYTCNIHLRYTFLFKTRLKEKCIVFCKSVIVSFVIDQSNNIATLPKMAAVAKLYKLSAWQPKPYTSTEIRFKFTFLKQLNFVHDITY